MVLVKDLCDFYVSTAVPVRDLALDFGISMAFLVFYGVIAFYLYSLFIWFKSESKNRLQFIAYIVVAIILVLINTFIMDELREYDDQRWENHTDLP